MNSLAPSLVQLQIRQGAAAGHILSADQLPIRLGRGKGCHLQLTEEGVWEQHGEIDVNIDQQFILRRHPAGEITTLGNGDEIELGTTKLQFWLGGVRQKNLAVREAAAWVLLGTITLAEVILLLWLT